MTDIQLVDVSIRDGNQSLWSATGLSTRQILQIAPVVNRVGFKCLDFTSSTHMAVAVRYFREDPWERIRLMHAACPDTPLQLITTGFRFISWETADYDFMRLVYRTLMKNGIGRFILLDPMHDMDALLAGARIIKEEGDADVMGALTYTVSDVHDDQFYADCTAHMAASPDVDLVYIKDPSGLLTPERARTLVPAVQKAAGDMPVEIHSHCTIGLSQFNYLVAADAGIDVMHTAVGPLANGSSLPPARQTIDNLRAHGHQVHVNEKALQQMTDYFTALARAEGLPAGMPQAYDARFMRHQVAGGVMTTTRRQLAEVNLEHRFDEVMEEVERVRTELGSPIMVTPFPQIVCTQATFNVIGPERYANVPDQVVRYVLGRFGRPTAPVDENILDKIMSLPRTKEIQQEPTSMALEDIRKQFSKNLSDEEFLLRAVMPQEQVDAMLANSPSRTRYNSRLSPVVKLIKEVSQRPGARELNLEKEGFKLRLRGNGKVRSEA
ncbi:MAG: biotin carboxyl carrier protein [Gammaproteobacteria bacterium]